MAHVVDAETLRGQLEGLGIGCHPGADGRRALSDRVRAEVAIDIKAMKRIPP